MLLNRFVSIYICIFSYTNLKEIPEILQTFYQIISEWISDINFCSQVAPYKKVRKVFFTEAIPKSAAGKVLRRELGKHPPSKLWDLDCFSFSLYGWWQSWVYWGKNGTLTLRREVIVLVLVVTSKFWYFGIHFCSLLQSLSLKSLR